MSDAVDTQADTRETRALDTAAEIFLRQGFARTTMGDIAQGVGISRPALYLMFSNKEAIFGGVIERMNAAQLAAIRRQLPDQRTLHEQLLLACQTWGAHGFDMMQANPPAADLFDISRASVRQVYAAFEELIVELLKEPIARSNCDATPEELARTLAYAMRGFRDTAVDGRDMRRLIERQVSLVSSNLESDAGQV